MKLDLICPDCLKLRGYGEPSSVAVPLNETGIYTYTCRLGHPSVSVLMHARFDVLATEAIQAIVDGYYRDAVMSFAAALERFYEFYFFVIGADKGVPGNSLQEVWKTARLSERRLGIFVGLYAMENHCCPPQFPQKRTNFRNDVAHNGLIPTEQEAADFGQAVVDYIQLLLDQMRPKYREQMEGEISRVVADAKRSASQQHNGEVLTAGFRTIFDVADIGMYGRTDVVGWVSLIRSLQ